MRMFARQSARWCRAAAAAARRERAADVNIYPIARMAHTQPPPQRTHDTQTYNYRSTRACACAAHSLPTTRSRSPIYSSLVSTRIGAHRTPSSCSCAHEQPHNPLLDDDFCARTRPIAQFPSVSAQLDVSLCVRVYLLVLCAYAHANASISIFSAAHDAFIFSQLTSTCGLVYSYYCNGSPISAFCKIVKPRALVLIPP